MLSGGKLFIATAVLFGVGYLAYWPMAGVLGVADTRDLTPDEDLPTEVVEKKAPNTDSGAVDTKSDAPDVKPEVAEEAADEGENDIDIADAGERPEPEIDEKFVLPEEDATGGGPPLPELIGLDPSDYPEEVMLRRSVKLTNADGKEKFLLPEKRVTPVGVEGEMLLIAMTSDKSYRGMVKVRETDLLEKLAFRDKIEKRIDELGLKYAGLDKELSKVDLGDSQEEIELIGEEPVGKLVADSLAAGGLDGYTKEAVTSTKYLGRSFVAGSGVYEVLEVEFLHDTIFGKEKIVLLALVKEGELRGWAYGGPDVIVPMLVPGTDE